MRIEQGLTLPKSKYYELVKLCHNINRRGPIFLDTVQLRRDLVKG